VVPYIETVPGAGDDDFYNELNEEVDSKYEQHRSSKDPRFTSAIAWGAGILSVFFTSTMIWMASSVVDIKANIAVLLARPEGISRAEYNRDQQRRDQDQARYDAELERIANEVHKESLRGR
jgi:hypothetical protein